MYVDSRGTVPLRLFRDDVGGVLLDWRHARGYDKVSQKQTNIKQYSEA
jgi:hypothetical protein